jgi:hypothetical protein
VAIESQSNKILLNNNGVLKESTQALSGENYLHTTSASYLDMDNDGDLDILTISMLGDVIMFKNNISDKNSISFSLRDEKTDNSQGIGASIIITTPDNKTQIRYVYLGGHFISLQNPRSHF